MRKFEWDCEKRGCFNKKHRLDFSVFFDCLPRSISFTDVDGFVEVGGQILLMEWKDGNRTLGTGQRIAFERLTQGHPRSVVLVVDGDASKMAVRGVQVVRDGKFSFWRDVDTAAVRGFIKKWASQADGRLAETLRMFESAKAFTKSKDKDAA